MRSDPAYPWGVRPDRLCQIEWVVSDLDASLRFYEEAFGWTRAPAEIQGFYVLNVPSGCPFGLALVQGVPSQDSHRAVRHSPVLHFAVSPMARQEIVRLVPLFGGAVLGSPRQVPGAGSIQLVSDPDSHRLGLFCSMNA